ncbi:hypothetical protein [Sessilibacter sp. MAH4]
MTNQLPRNMKDYVHIPGSKNGIGRGVFAHKDIAKTLIEFNRSGNYHKITLVKLLQGLTAGHDHEDNILQAANPAARKLTQFAVNLPGCMAQVVRSANGNYYVTDIVAKPEQTKTLNETGLYKAKKNDKSEWGTFIEDKITPNPHGTTRIAVTDSTKQSDKAAINGAKALSESEYMEKSSFNQYYLHHTYGEGDITGYVRRRSITNPLSIKEIRDSSKLLAQAMMQARVESQRIAATKPKEMPQTAWISSRGGSAVLTQALHRLKQRGISFHDHNHHVFFHEIASDVDIAMKLALDLGFKMPSKPFTKRLWSFKSLAVGGGHGGTHYRTKAEQKYTQQMASLQHASNATLPAMGILGAATLISGSALTGIALISVARKAHAIVTTVDHIATEVAGNRYDKLKRKTGFIK